MVLVNWRIQKKVEALTKRGFNDPIKLIASLPMILGISIDNIDRKIQGLRDQGFNNPVKLLTTAPSIFCYSFDNIDRKIRFAKRIGYKKFIELIVYRPSLLGLSIKRYFFVARTLCGHKKEEITFSLIKRTQELMPK